MQTVCDQPRRGAAVIGIKELEYAFDRPRHRGVVLWIVALELASVGLRALEAVDDRGDPLGRGEIVLGDHLARNPTGVKRQGDNRTCPILACSAVNQHGAVGSGDLPDRRDGRVGAIGQVAKVGADQRGLFREALATDRRPGPRTGADRLHVEIGVALRRIQRVMRNPHAGLPRERTRSLERNLDVGSEIEDHLEPMVLEQAPDIGRGESLEIVRAQQHARHHRTSVHGAVEVDPQRRLTHKPHAPTYLQRFRIGMGTTRNLVNLSGVGKDHAARTILEDVTLGIADRDRIGVVGGNGQGKSTLLELIAGAQQADSGQVTRVGGLRIGILDQGDRLAPGETIAEVLVGDRPEHEWAGDREFRGVLEGLLGGVALDRFTGGIETPVAGLSGGERRRIALALTLLDHPDLLLLDEPTNHLDVEAIAWLGAHLAARDGAMLVVTHDRWFLDAVSTRTWEVADRAVHQYEGGYAAYVLARAERDRQRETREDRRQQLMRKELAWLRRGPPARTSKPRFRIDAANALIADEPPARDSTELLRFASSRLGNKVLEAEDIAYGYGDLSVLSHLTWRIGPGDRLALVGANGSGKSTLLRLLAGELTPIRGEVRRGQTVKLAHLSQEALPVAGRMTVLEAVEEVRGRATLAGGEEITAGRLADRFGFRGEKARTPVGELSGGERRRLTLMRLLMSEPNVLLLDEPTNDLDIETLTALEDLLDHWPGTLLLVSHDRYFVERVADNVFALDALGGLRHLPGGIDQYLAELAPPVAATGALGPAPSSGAVPAGAPAPKAGTLIRQAGKELQRIERELDRLSADEQRLHAAMAEQATDHSSLSALTVELEALVAERDHLESAWLETSALLDA